MVLLHFFTTGSCFFLVISIGFVLIGAEEFVHAVFSFNRIWTEIPPTFKLAVSTTWLTGHCILLTALFSALFLRKEAIVPCKRMLNAVAYNLNGLIFASVVSLLIFSSPFLPHFVQLGSLTKKLIELAFALIYFTAFLFYFDIHVKQQQVRSPLFLSITAFLLFRVLAHIFVFDARAFYDAHWDMAHLIVFLSYFFPIFGVWGETIKSHRTTQSQVIELKKEITARLSAEQAGMRAEAALRASGERLSIALEVGNAGVWEWDRNSGEVRFDARFHEMLGYTAGELPTTAQEWASYHHSEDLQPMLSKAEAYLRGESPVFENEHRIRTKAGAWAWVFTRARLVDLSAAASPKQFIGIAINITERKRAELELGRLNRDLIEKKKEMENFLYITTHDLRGPLVNIQGFSQNLERYASELRGALAAEALPAALKKTLDKIAGESIPGALKFVLESSRKMDSLITALLKVSRLGRVEMKPETVEMNELLKKLQTSMQYQLKDSGGEIKSGNLPPCKADPGAVSQLFSNLLDNAVKYRDKDRPLVVTVAGDVKGGLVTYTVADNGSGISEADLHRIWNVFSRSARAPGRTGEGIGLPMVRLIAEKNGGGIRAESQDGVGSVFYVQLPAAGEGGNGK